MGTTCCDQREQAQELLNTVTPGLNLCDYHESQWPRSDKVLQEWFAKNSEFKGRRDKPLKLLSSRLQVYFYGKQIDSQPHQRCLIYHPKVILLDGYFHRGILEGKCFVKFLETGSTYEGEVKSGKAEGRGKFIDAKQQIRLQGKWHCSFPSEGTMRFDNDPNIEMVKFEDPGDPTGTIVYRDGRKYQGHLNTINMNPEGHGTVHYPPSSNNVLYKGEWSNGKMCGKGNFQWRDGSEYQGSYFNGFKEGEGTFISHTKLLYKGFWKKGKQQGPGIVYLRNKGRIEAIEGVWAEGILKEVSRERAVTPSEELQFSKAMRKFLPDQ